LERRPRASRKRCTGISSPPARGRHRVSRRDGALWTNASACRKRCQSDCADSSLYGRRPTHLGAQLRYPVGWRARPQRAFLGLRSPRHRGRPRAGLAAAPGAALLTLAAHPDASDHAERIRHSSPAGPLNPAAGGAHRRPGRARAALELPHAPLLQDRCAREVRLRARRKATRHRRVIRSPAGASTLIGHAIEAAEGFPRPASTIAALASDPSASDSVVDLYLHWSEPFARCRHDGRRAGAAPNGRSCPRRVRSVAVAVGSRAGADVHHFMFRPPKRVFKRSALLVSSTHDRAAAPSLAASQLRAYARAGGRGRPPLPLRRAREPSDERLVALAEVRHLTPVHDAAGRLTALPEPERVLAACLDGIPLVAGQRPPNRRLHGNRVLLYVWPSIDVPLTSWLRSRARWPSAHGRVGSGGGV